MSLFGECKYQLLATLCANINTIAFGCACGWPAPSFPVLLSDESPLPSGPMSMEEISWVSSLICIGNLIGNYFFGWTADKYGRKISLISMAIPIIVAWTLVQVATNPFYLYASRISNGIAGGGIFVVMPIFVSEISDNNVRGTLGSLLVFMFNLGVVFAFALGCYFSYTTIPLILITLPILFLFAFIFFPESPQFLMKNNRHEEAERALRFYRRGNGDSNKLDKDTKNSVLAAEFGPMITKTELSNSKEMYVINGSGDGENGEPLYSEDEEVNNNNNDEKKNTVTWSDYTTGVGKKGMFIGLSLIVLCQFCGCFVLMNYTDTIFKESGSKMSSNMAAVVAGAIQFVGAYVSTVLVDRTGRKFLMAASAIGTSIGLVIFGIYIQFKSSGMDLAGYEWIPLASFTFAIFVANWGLLSLPFLIISELLPDNIRTNGSSFCMAVLYVFGFILMKLFPWLIATLGMNGCLYLFSVVSFGGFLFVIFILPETNGKSHEEIMRMLAK